MLAAAARLPLKLRTACAHTRLDSLTVLSLGGLLNDVYKS